MMELSLMSAQHFPAVSGAFMDSPYNGNTSLQTSTSNLNANFSRPTEAEEEGKYSSDAIWLWVAVIATIGNIVVAQVPTVYGSNYVPELTYTTPTHQLLIDHGPPLTTMDDGPPTHDKTSSQPQAQAARNSRAVAGEMDESLLREENCRSKEQLDSQELSTLPLPPRTYRLIKADFLYPQYSRDSMCD